MEDKATVKYLGKTDDLTISLSYLSGKYTFPGKKGECEMPLIDARKLIGANPLGFVGTHLNGNPIAPGTITGVNIKTVSMSGFKADVEYLGNKKDKRVVFKLGYLSRPMEFISKMAAGVPYEDAAAIVDRNPKTFVIVNEIPPDPKPNKPEPEILPEPEPEPEEETEGDAPPDTEPDPADADETEPKPEEEPESDEAGDAEGDVASKESRDDVILSAVKQALTNGAKNTDGKANVKAVETITGFNISSEERDFAMELIKEEED